MSGDLRPAVEALRFISGVNDWADGFNSALDAVQDMIPEGAVLVTYREHGENDARHHYVFRCQVCGEQGRVTVAIEPEYVLRYLREGK